MIKLGAHNDWTKSSHSCGYNNCVIVRSPEPDAVQVGDSKFDHTPVLRVSPSAFRALTEHVAD
jgi:uncharacterized protein DUF397